MPIKVLIVDDSALIRKLLSAIVQAEPDFELVGAAADAYIARDMVNQFAPDVITLDIEMPKVDGLTFLEKLMKARPTPVLMISTLTERGSEATLRALELGAVDYIAKPKIGISEGLSEYQQDIVSKIRTVAKANIKRKRPQSRPPVTSLNYTGTEKIIAIGASTGGTEAIKEVLLQMPAACPAIVITQHMPPGFTRSFAERLNKLCTITVKEAAHNERVLPGCAYIAPGDLHLTVTRSGADYRVTLTDTERVSGHKPSVDVMFESLAQVAGPNVLAAILTGMGKDGARGMLDIRNKGGYTVAQDEASCVVFGMPAEAIRLGAVEKICSIEAVAGALLERLKQLGSGNRV